MVCILFLQAYPLSFTSIDIDAFHILLVTMFFPLTIIATGSPGPHSTVQSSIQPQQQPADTKAQQQPQHEVHLLFGHTVTHKVILRRVHERMVSVIWNYVVNMMPRAERGELCLEVYIQQQKEIDGNIKYKMIKKTINKEMDNEDIQYYVNYTNACFNNALRVSRVGKPAFLYSTDTIWIQLSSVKLGLLSWNI